MNGITLTIGGKLTRDPDYSTVGSGTSLCKFSLAVERRFKSGDEWDKAVSFVDIVCWKDLADKAAQLLTKGSLVVVSGRFDQQSWEDRETGAKRSRFELTADDIAVNIKYMDSWERTPYAEPAAVGARPGGPARSGGPGRPQPAPRRAASYDDDSVWDN